MNIWQSSDLVKTVIYVTKICRKSEYLITLYKNERQGYKTDC